MKLYLNVWYQLKVALSGARVLFFYAFFCWTLENEVSMLDDLIVVSFLCCNTLCEAFLEACVWRLWFVGIIVLLKLVAIWMSLVYKFLRYLCSTQYWSNANDAASSLDLLWNLSFVIRKQELRFRVCILWMLGSTEGERGMLGLARHAWMITGEYDRCSLSFCP